MSQWTDLPRLWRRLLAAGLAVTAAGRGPGAGHTLLFTRLGYYFTNYKLRFMKQWAAQPHRLVNIAQETGECW